MELNKIVERKIVAIIPARSGSKGIINKNIKNLCGKPLLYYTIEAAKRADIFENIIVSTDSEKYADIATKCGAEVPFLRDESLSNDNASSNDVVIDVIKKMNNVGKVYDYFMLLQPTSPLRTYNDIIDALQLFYNKKANAVVSVCECEHPLQWTCFLSNEQRLDDFSNKNLYLRQMYNVMYRLNGAIYLCNVEYFLKYRNYYKSNCYAYIMSKEKSIDIDDDLDFKFAEYIMQEKIDKKIRR